MKIRTQRILAAVLAVSMVFVLSARSARAGTVVLDTEAELEDAWTYWGGSYGSNANALQLENSAGGYLKHVFLKFDVSAVPAGATIDSATYHIATNGTKWGANDQPVINFHHVTKPWVEDEVSWAQYSAGNAWDTPGGDYETPPVITVDLPIIGLWTYFDLDLTVAVQAWVDGTKPNYGLMMKYPVDGPDHTGLQFCGSEAWADGSGYQHLAPTMTIEYTAAAIPEPAGLGLIGLALLGLRKRRS